MLVLVAFGCALAVCFADEPQKKQPAGKKSNSNANTLCYVCHIDLQTEQITTVHLAQGITCVNCHGSSSHHMHDEMLMTKPDILYGRQEVEQMCRRCHQAHKNPEAVEAFRKEWSGRTRPNGRAVTTESICTDCHGTHNIVKKTVTASDKEQPSEWIALFNGRNFDNWRVSGKASWKIERSSIVATAGSKGRGGDLWTRQAFTDYLLSVTFQATWPIHAGIWLRGADGPRIEIFESRKPKAFTGSVRAADEGPALLNPRSDLEDRESWNTISVKVQGDRLQVWLNGEEVGTVRVKGPKKGKIGLHLESGPTYKAAQLRVREVLLQRLDESPAKADTLSKD
ncbi:MAG: family 16 glycoside hydrolase [Planctomycetota bacterium]|jgi:hypothetical protein